MKCRMCHLLAIGILVEAIIACSSGEGSSSLPSSDDKSDTIDTISRYDWEKTRTAVLTNTDMVLLYGGSHQRDPYNWNISYLTPYVVYTDSVQNSHWMFDSFLFLEIMDKGVGGSNKMFADGYGLESANQNDWNNLINYYFQSDKNIGALDQCILNATLQLGSPETKRQIIISIPEPIIYQNPSETSSSTTYWGKIDGKTLDFSLADDRVKACKWFIDRVRAKFNELGYKNVELGGFYWLAEKANSDTQSVISSIAKYLAKLKYSFNWIPYYNASGYNRWNSFGFTEAYLQPNYFFSESVPYSRLDDACQEANTYNMGMEIEFDDNALTANGKAYRLRNYMSVFKEDEIWDNKRLAYYQGRSSLLSLKNSSTVADIQLYRDFCNFVVNRPIRGDN